MVSPSEQAKLSTPTDVALAQWYKSFISDQDPDLILAGTPSASPQRMARVFQEWVNHHRAELRTAVCGKSLYGRFTTSQKEAAEIAAIAAISTALATTDFLKGVDPTLTAVILVSRRYLDSICQAQDLDDPNK